MAKFDEYRPCPSGVKEYKVLRFPFYDSTIQERDSGVLNNYASDGWTVSQMSSDRYGVSFLLERDER